MSLSGLGMTLFFVLSGVVIHYNYGVLIGEPGGIGKFAIARFSRLYPLYILLFLIEFTLTFTSPSGSDESGSCGQTGHIAGLLFALPFYVTMTQDWAYGVICKNSLIYQYGMMSEVTWSISAEVFFYLAYCFYGRWAAGKRPVTLFVVSGLAYLLLFAFLRACHLHRGMIDDAALAAFGPVATELYGYQDSVIRWLFYFNPLSQFPHFVAGVAIAQCCLAGNPAGRQSNTQLLNWAVAGSVLVSLAAHFYLYGIVAYRSSFVGRNASSLYGPLLVLAVCMIARNHRSVLSRVLSRPLIVKAGEASYSLYLLHAFLAWNLRQLADVGLRGWTLWAVSMLSLLYVSRVSYVCFERPARNMLRRLLSSGSDAASAPESARSAPIDLGPKVYPAGRSRSAG